MGLSWWRSGHQGNQDRQEGQGTDEQTGGATGTAPPHDTGTPERVTPSLVRDAVSCDLSTPTLR